jgi:hypothetical protein
MARPGVFFAAIVAAALAAGAAYALWPVCVPIPSADAAAFQPPIAKRDDRYLFGPVFQERAGQWHQCKTRIGRAFFF